MFEMGILLNKVDLDKPDELLESDSKYAKGHNPMVGKDSKANK
jgi:glycerol-3-phosphate dehydrogenase